MIYKYIGFIFYYIIFSEIIHSSFSITLRNNDEDISKNVTELIISKGYDCTNYEVITSDGYILSLQRISKRKTNALKNDKKKVKNLNIKIEGQIFNNMNNNLKNSFSMKPLQGDDLLKDSLVNEDIISKDFPNIINTILDNDLESQIFLNKSRAMLNNFYIIFNNTTKGYINDTNIHKNKNFKSINSYLYSIKKNIKKLNFTKFYNLIWNRSNALDKIVLNIKNDNNIIKLSQLNKSLNTISQISVKNKNKIIDAIMLNHHFKNKYDTRSEMSNKISFNNYDKPLNNEINHSNEELNGIDIISKNMVQTVFIDNENILTIKGDNMTKFDKNNSQINDILIDTNFSDTVNIIQDFKDFDDKIKPVVYLQHGLLDSASTWVINSANESLGFILADKGYDVWLGNSRGNIYSRKHVHYSPHDPEFWDFSYDEMAFLDLPAIIEFIINSTSANQIHYIGHSQGGLIGLAGLTKNKYLASKIKNFIGLAPAAYVDQIEGVAKYLLETLIVPEILFKIFGVHEFLPSTQEMDWLASYFCHQYIAREICKNFLFLISGFNNKEMNMSRIPVYVSHTPAGTSVKNMVHYSQVFKAKRFQRFDYGVEKNMLYYNQSEAPVYNLSAIDTPVHIFAGSKDYLADSKDIKKLVEELKTIKTFREYPEWAHLDFVWGCKPYQLVHDILNILDTS